MRFSNLLVYGLILMVPIAPFGIFGSVFQSSGAMVTLAYAIGMLAMMFTAGSCAQMSRAFLSFLGFDASSTLAEEKRDSARAIGRSMVAALLLAGTLFIVQTWSRPCSSTTRPS